MIEFSVAEHIYPIIKSDFMNRKEWLKQSGLLAAGSMAVPSILSIISSENPSDIMVVSGWQMVNIGDVAHTPGLIHLLRSYLPDVNITLWAQDVDLVKEQILKANFPNLKIVYGGLNEEGLPEDENVLNAISQSRILIHGSGPGIIGRERVQAWRRLTDKPYGIFGVTIGNVWPELKDIIENAAFLFTRETNSFKVLESAGVTNPEIHFAPDATFMLNIRNDASASRYMNLNNLEDRKFICVVPRSRYTPYHRIHDYLRWDKEHINYVIEENLRYAEEDHEKMRVAIIRWVRETGHKVVLCPEMEYQTELFEPYLYNPLPDDVKCHVEMHPYWMPDDAASLYSHAAAVISAEAHSPIISLVNGTPAFYLRQPSDTIKGQMYYDLKLDDWVFEIEETTGEDVADRLMEVYNNYERSLETVGELNNRVRHIYDESMEIVEKLIF